MRFLLVLAITISVLLAFGVACGGGEEETGVIPSPASDSEGEEEAEEVDEWGAQEEADWEAEEEEEAEETEEGEAPPEGTEVVVDLDDDGVFDDDDLCPHTVAGDAVDDVGCSDAQVDQDGDGICDPAAASDGPGDCDLTDDNCPESPNRDQEDFDGDLAGDACDRDDDDDGFTDADEVSTGSDHLDDASVPENEAVNPGSCTDGVDNDLDGGIDTDRACR